MRNLLLAGTTRGSVTPDTHEARRRQADAFTQSGDHDRAMALWEDVHSQTCSPEDGLNAAVAAFRCDKWETAWPLYENRYLRNPEGNLPAITCADTGAKIPHWTGGPPPRRLLIIAEQGLGDTFHFLRYVRRLIEEEVTVTLAEWPHLHPLLKSVHPQLRLTPRNKAVTAEAGDAFVRLMSLPLRMGIAAPYFDSPYLAARSSLARRLSKVIDPARCNIGLVWQGNPDHKQDLRRSIRLDDFALLAEREDCCLISLQHGHGQGQIQDVPFADRLVLPAGLDSGKASFLGTAALISQLDAIVTVDTATAHLAGAMGRKVLLLLHAPDPDWRWGASRNNTPWYPNTQLFRQSQQGDWSEPITRVAAAIASL
ncbi:glycosyltransferase family 9 protein [Maricaulis maris]|uniref:glycosyltransferase family 9 protein n=1 Tax=Maricaulis maris TaxID=74318 RepID=UPI002924DA53|nr:hypothetical protein MACH15_09490 [Maricaulis maris]